jgi:hypothetical protein
MWGCIWREAEMHVSRVRVGQALDGVGFRERSVGGGGGVFVVRAYVAKISK